MTEQDVTIQGRDGVKAAYRDEALVDAYIEDRFHDPFGSEVHRRQVALVNALMDRTRPAQVLEIACGPARVTADLVPPRRAVAIEQSPAMIARARRRLTARDKTSWQLLRGDAFELPFRPESFDLVLTFRFLRHFGPDDRKRLMDGIRRTLRPGGRVVFDVAHRTAYDWLLRKWGVSGKWVDDYRFERAELVDELRRQGWRLESLLPVQSMTTMQYYVFAHLHPRVPALARAVSRALTAASAANAYEWVAVCTGE